MNNVYVLDACALIAYLNDEQGADKVEEILIKAEKGGCRLYIHVINLYEIYYDYNKRVVESERAEELLESFWNRLNQMPMQIYRDFDYSLLNKAASFKAYFRISLADSIALGLAESKEAKLITSDHHEFDVIEENELIEFYWLR